MVRNVPPSFVRRGRVDSPAAVLVRSRQIEPARGHRAHGNCAVRRRCDAVAVYRAQRVAERRTYAGDRRDCRRRHIFHREPVGRKPRLTAGLRIEDRGSREEFLFSPRSSCLDPGLANAAI